MNKKKAPQSKLKVPGSIFLLKGFHSPLLYRKHMTDVHCDRFSLIRLSQLAAIARFCKLAQSYPDQTLFCFYLPVPFITVSPDSLNRALLYLNAFCLHPTQFHHHRKNYRAN
jgi:hypothetical protein